MNFLNLNIVIDENGIITTNNHRLPLHLNQVQPLQPLQDNNSNLNATLDSAAESAPADAPAVVPTATSPMLPRDILEVISRHKLVIPFVVLLLIKLLVNSVSELVIFSVSMYLLSRIKSGIEIQLALKRRCDVMMLVVLLIAAVISICYVFIVMNITGNYQIWNRIFFIFDDAGLTEKTTSIDAANVFSTVWLVAMTDITLMFIVSAIKLTLFIVFKYIKPSSVTMCNRNSLINNLSSYAILPDADVESGLPSAISSHQAAAAVNNNRSLVIDSLYLETSVIDTHSNNSSDVTNDSNITSNSNSNTVDTVRRRERSRDNNDQVDRSDRIEDVPHGTSHFSMNSSDIDTHEESLSFVFHLRLFASIDAAMLVYRSMLPFSVWLSFFSTGTAGGLFAAIYFFIKLVNMWSKVGDMITVVLIFITGKLEYGQYATAAEIRGATDCPICFDAPQRCVKLPCEHCFCEVCILEWLDKEKTCPVCRAAVTSQSPAIDDIKEQASKLFPIVI